MRYSEKYDMLGMRGKGESVYLFCHRGIRDRSSNHVKTVQYLPMKRSFTLEEAVHQLCLLI